MHHCFLRVHTGNMKNSNISQIFQKWMYDKIFLALQYVEFTLIKIATEMRFCVIFILFSTY